MITLSPGHDRPDGLDGSSDDKFAHTHDTEENSEHDSADEHREAEDQRRLEHGEKTLHRDLYFAVVDLGDTVEHLLEPTGFLADQDQLCRKSRVDARLGQRHAEALALAQARDDAIERLGEHR